MTRLTFFIKTFGCQMNAYDSLRIAQLLESHGYRKVSSYQEAAIILINTCTVRQKAEDKIYSELGRIKRFKEKKSTLIIAIGGCLAQQKGFSLIKKHPYIDIVFGTKAISRLPVLIDRALNRSAKVVDIDLETHTDIYPENTCNQCTAQISAFVSIMQGCNNFCSYCIVPYVRGREWSRTPAAICSEIINLAQRGTKEITLLGQNVNSYGKTLNPQIHFPDLLYTLNDISGLERIRFTTSHPKDLSPELMHCFKNLSKVCEHIHLPLQSGSNSVLNAMNRNYTIEEYLDKIRLLRETIPDMSITSDIIVGFPGETEKDFSQTCDVIEKISFDDLFIFHYTYREGTKAAQLPDMLPYEKKIGRLKVLNDLQRSISSRKNRFLIGKTEAVLFEQVSKKGALTIAGRTRTNKVVNCNGSPDNIGKILKVKIDKANIHSLNGQLLIDMEA